MAQGKDRRTVKGQSRSAWAQSMGFTSARNRRSGVSRYSPTTDETPF